MHQTDWQPHRLHLCHKTTTIEIVGTMHSFDPVIHDNSRPHPFLFNSTSDADPFLSILAFYPQPLLFAANVRPLITITFGLETFCLTREWETVDCVRILDVHYQSVIQQPLPPQSWFMALAFSIRPKCIRDYRLSIKITCIHCWDVVQR